MTNNFRKKRLALSVAAILAGGYIAGASAATDTVTGSDSAATGGTPIAPGLAGSTFAVAVKDNSANTVGTWTWDYDTSTWSTDAGSFTADATNTNVFIGAHNGNVSVVTLPPDGPRNPNGTPPNGAGTGVPTPVLDATDTPVVDPLATKNSNLANGAYTSSVLGTSTVAGSVSSTNARATQDTNYATLGNVPTIAYTFDDTVNNTNDFTQTGTSVFAPPELSTAESREATGPRSDVTTNFTVTSNTAAYKTGAYTATDNGDGDGTADVEGSAVTADADGFRVTKLSGTATTDANADVTVDLTEEDIVAVDNTGITVDNGGNVDINGGGTLSVDGATTTNGITNTGDVATDTLTTTGNADVGGDLSVAGASTTNGITNTGDVATDTLTTTGNADVGGDLSVAGASTTNGITNTGDVATDTLTTTGNASIGGDADVTGNADVTGDLSVGGNTSLMGDLTVDGMLGVQGDAAVTGNLTVGGSINSAMGVDAAITSSTRNASLVNNINQGLVVGPNSTRLSGGTGSTSLTLSDSGATFGNTTTGGGPAKVTGVADGTGRYDAVNYGQLERAYEGIAAAAAIAALPQPAAGKNYTVGLGYGNFAGENAMAVGAKANYQNFSGTVGGAFSGSEEMVNVGVGYSW